LPQTLLLLAGATGVPDAYSCENMSLPQKLKRARPKLLHNVQRCSLETKPCNEYACVAIKQNAAQHAKLQNCGPKNKELTHFENEAEGIETH
jgi:hypothetical protein